MCSPSYVVHRHLAGKAEMKLTLTGPRGNDIPYDMYTTSTGEHVTYHAKEAGIYEIYITYGGLKVPGMIRFYLSSSLFNLFLRASVIRTFCSMSSIFIQMLYSFIFHSHFFPEPR